jgi:hypothetical protein
MSILLFLTRDQIVAAGLDFKVLFGGNILLFLITALALFFHKKGMENKNPNVFFRAVYGSMIARMFLCILIILVYVSFAGDNFNKTSLLLCFVFYFLYSFLEVYRVFSLFKKKH